MAHPEATENATLKTANVYEPEPYILKAEVEAALNKLKTHKSPGVDNITLEMIIATGETGITLLHKLCQSIWDTCTWPDDWTTSVYIPLHKKGSREICDNYRTIALIPHASKVMLQVILERLKTCLLPEISEEQAGFVPGRGTREQILNIRQIIEKSREFNVLTYVCFIDYSKAFDCVRWQDMWKYLSEMGTPGHLVELLKGLYQNNTAKVKVNGELTESFRVGKGVRQGCVVSPLLFNIYGECIIRKATEGWEGGISVGGRTINNLRYADDTTLFASNEQELTELLQRVEMASQEAGLTINRSKTKIMIIDRPRNNRPETKEINGIAVVNQFVYLGSLITNLGGCTPEIKRRSAVAKEAMAKLTKIWKSHDITLSTKIRLVKTLVFSVFLYASECWALKETDKRAIDAFEMCCWRKMLRISWTQRVTNESILNQLKIKKRLRTIVSERITSFFGHIVRRNGLEKLTVQGKVQGTRSRGRSPIRYVDHIVRETGVPLNECFKAAEDRQIWKDLTDHRS